jgi:hypothetical protein
MEKLYNIGSDDDSDDDSDVDSNADDESDEDDEEETNALEAALAGDDDVEEEWVDDEEDVYDEGHEYLEYLAQQAAKTRTAKADGEEEEEEEEDEDDFDLEEEIYFESPLDDLDPYIVFREVFTGLQQHNPASYAELTKETTPEQQEYIMQLINVGEVNAAAAAENAAAATEA